MRLKFEILDK